MFLTKSELFKRKYSSIYRVLKSYFFLRNANSDQKIRLCRKIIKYLTTLYTKNSKKNIYALDTTNYYRSCASKGVDRKNVTSKNNQLSEAWGMSTVYCAT